MLFRSRKGRAFRGYELASVRADRLWSGGETDTGEIERPVWVMFAAGDQEIRPFIANVAAGRKAALVEPRGDINRGKGLELLRSAGYRFTFQREAEGVIATACIPELFAIDPGMIDPAGVRFVLLPSAEWAMAQEIDTNAIVRHVQRLTPRPPLDDAQVASLAATAFLFAAYLDRRTRAPLPADGRFYVQLLLACLRDGVASWTSPLERHRRDERRWGINPKLQFFERGTTGVGLLPGLAVSTSHETLERLLAAQVSKFFGNAVGRKK